MKTIIKADIFAYHLIADFVESENKTSIEAFIEQMYERGQSKELAKLFSEYDDETISIEDFDEYKMNNYNIYKNFVVELYNKFGEDLTALEKYLFEMYSHIQGEFELKQKKTKMVIIFKEAGLTVQGHAIETVFKKIINEVDDLMDCSEQYWGKSRTWIGEHQAITFYCNCDTRKVIEEVMLNEKYNSIVEFKEA